MKTPIIEFKDFNFRYKSQTEPTLFDINLQIYPGEKVLILGPSGSGKSTLANCINGLIPHSFAGFITGSLKVAGKETKDASIFSLSKSVGTVLQDSDAQFVGLSVGEDVAFALENEMVPRSEMLKRVDEACEMVGMQEFISHLPYNLSGGQKQKVSLAGVIHENVSIVLFDEPLAALDPAMGMIAIDLIDKIHREQNKTTIIIEHRLEDVLYRPIDRIILLDEGRIVRDTTPNELLASGLLNECGIREPLYLAALRFAGCEVKASDNLADIYQMDLSVYKDKLLKHQGVKTTSQKAEKQEEILRVENVSFSYTDKVVVNDVSFTIHSGERIAIVGKNGAGKSTMAKLICGIERPNKGKIYYEGTDYLKYTIKELGEKIGYVMQNPNQMLVKDMIKDEVGMALKLRDFSDEQIEERIEKALKMCGLFSMRNWPVSVVSYGQKKRITIASILALEPKIIILDEPTAGQDYFHYTEIMDFLEELSKNHGITVLFITHDMHLAIEYTDRAIVFAEANMIADDSVFKVLSNDEVIKTANLKQTSLYTLAKRIGVEPELFIKHFIEYEREYDHE